MVISAVQQVKLQDDDVDLICSQLNEERNRKIQSFLRPEDVCCALIGDVLSRVLLCIYLNTPMHLLSIKRTVNGKPYTTNADCYFNISHSGEWIVCGVYDKPLGIDVEQIRTIDVNIAKRYFSPTEAESLFKRAQQERLQYFFELWTLKESYIKMLGTGFNMPFNSFSVQVHSNKKEYIGTPKGKAFKFKQYPIDPAYKMAVCSVTDACFPKHVNVYSWNDLFESFRSLLY
ncbi:4'-phosphopantetheinyl transferase superfamily protein [Alkalihalobacillus sp. TS-13]|uniref:4'-phosphopantetheinyl transferase family protein n=1 Tax=Alkalihalobacillus sp. TS-13 TaxID=2842455 RepID=UPI001C883877|nr:4'-phosphopantetheinyl transferase superfamily protein [Alkalihalobacillus sp. TS-13]